MTNVTIRLDSNDKAEFSRICEKIGLSVSAAFNVFVKTVIKEEKIPFELSAKEWFESLPILGSDYLS
ncbi:MAG: type II toxin-antitoxin system RelB/DinJ family antitoxin [Spirochaetaceae bacterium]|nr:type II toxin-antitoxin system RelB/DinJ family antitoxin [Spirochaetaceae bacterium]